jgi:hypothetical protein
MYIAILLLVGVPRFLPVTDNPALIHADTAEQYEIAEWALDRFHDADLDLPPLTIDFRGPDQAGCGDAPARAHLDHNPVLVAMCWSSPFILLHELAHIWESNHVTDSTRQTFTAMRTDIQAWASLEVPWDHRGREHAANVIAWGLLEDPYPVSRTYPNDPDSLTAAYNVLTNNEPLHNGGPPTPQPKRTQRTNPPLESGQ